MYSKLFVWNNRNVFADSSVETARRQGAEDKMFGGKKSINNNHTVSSGIFIWFFSGSWLFIWKIHRVIICHALNCLAFLTVTILFLEKRTHEPKKKKQKNKTHTKTKDGGVGCEIENNPFLHLNLMTSEDNIWRKEKEWLRKSYFQTLSGIPQKPLFWRNTPFLLWPALKRIISP